MGHWCGSVVAELGRWSAATTTQKGCSTGGCLMARQEEVSVVHWCGFFPG